MKRYLLLIIIITMLMGGCHVDSPKGIIALFSDPGELEILASKEVKRYLYQRSNVLFDVIETVNAMHASIIISSKENLPAGFVDEQLSEKIGQLKEQEYIVTTIDGTGNNKKILICGGGQTGTLYGAYRYIESLGIRFYPHGDVIPDEQIPFTIPDNLMIEGKPNFDLRGIVPFHDFPEGPDWWNTDDYKSVITQLAKMQMNFIGLHTYPEIEPFRGYERAEIATWIGPKDAINEDGTVNLAYPALHFNTMDSTWGYHPKKTSEFSFGASRLFDADNYGADYVKDITPWPHTEEENVMLFNEFGMLLGDAFSLAQRLGVNTCIGTETPLIPPQNILNHMYPDGNHPDRKQMTEELYEGVFTRINKTHPLDYYWLWTREFWTWRGPEEEDIDNTVQDVKIALDVADKLDVPFTLATSGWVVGPPQDPQLFHREFPKSMPFSSINRIVGYIPVDTTFGQITDRPRWVITWLEDDAAMISPQFWVGRTRKDAVDALRYGCSGYMGIHWRTKVLSPNFSALAQSGWEFGDWKDFAHDTVRHLPARDFYIDWSAAQFGASVASEMADIFTSFDGSDTGEYHHGNLFRPSGWYARSPGVVKVIPTPWDELRKEFDFLETFIALGDRIEGRGNIERYNYWLNMLLYTRAMAEVGCKLGLIESYVEKMRSETGHANKRQVIVHDILPLKAVAEKKWGEMVTYLLQSVSTTGELGMIANLEMTSLSSYRLLDRYDEELSEILGEPLPESKVWSDYRGEPRLIIPTRRSLLEPGEDYRVRAMVLSSEDVAPPVLYWKPLDKKRYSSIRFEHIDRGVYHATIPYDKIKGNNFEYYVQVKIPNSEDLKFPATAPDLNQSVVVW